MLLGEDLLLCDPSGPADIIQSEGMIFNEVPISLKMVRPSVVICVAVAENVEVPPMEEVIADAYVDRHENQNEEEEHR